MSRSVVSVHEDLLRSIAENGALPEGRQWAEDVQPIIVQAVKDALDEAFEAFRENVKDAGASSNGLVPPTTTTAFDHSEESFQSESSYIVEQLTMCNSRPLFTLQRLTELLLGQDALFRTARGGTLLRADVLQTAIRKCVLVSALQ
ncbi:Hypothetical protein, putative [Bodo saltans]|uniref:Uncharacterized protein n=1 Tax=Bodo saltans TaxID=75058 RepID=A0A0S4KJP2_BODSA|nr:Hypothetical protein, putative [Bodo saltans]|eukprot:CUI14681.1 Hypothetical protein, putative [Bodo saltans]